MSESKKRGLIIDIDGNKDGNLLLYVRHLLQRKSESIIFYSSEQLMELVDNIKSPINKEVVKYFLTYGKSKNKKDMINDLHISKQQAFNASVNSAYYLRRKLQVTSNFFILPDLSLFNKEEQKEIESVIRKIYDSLFKEIPDESNNPLDVNENIRRLKEITSQMRERKISERIEAYNMQNISEETLDTSLTKLMLPDHGVERLEKAGIKTLGDLRKLTEMEFVATPLPEYYEWLDFPEARTSMISIGSESLEKICRFMFNNNVTFRPDPRGHEVSFIEKIFDRLRSEKENRLTAISYNQKYGRRRPRPKPRKRDSSEQSSDDIQH